MKPENLTYELNNIRHYYDEKKVLDISHLEIQKGAIIGIVGPNGSGKSTLLKLLAFAQKPSFGEVCYQGKPQIPFSPEVRSKITLLTQRPYLLKRTVFENVAYGLKIRNKAVNIEKKAKKAIETVGLDYQNFSQRKWHELSGGEAQRVAMAARLVLEPDVLLLDEPVASVDMKSAELIRKASIMAKDLWGTTLIIASHDLQWLYSISDKQLSMVKGNIFSTGMENVITGPFERFDDRIVIKRLQNRHIIRLKAPDHGKDTAVIRKKDITIDIKKQTDQPTLNQLPGQISSMMLEKKSGHILAAISIHSFSFVLRLLPDQVSSLVLQPGKKVFLKFQSNNVEWI